MFSYLSFFVEFFEEFGGQEEGEGGVVAGGEGLDGDEGVGGGEVGIGGGVGDAHGDGDVVGMGVEGVAAVEGCGATFHRGHGVRLGDEVVEHLAVLADEAPVVAAQTHGADGGHGGKGGENGGEHDFLKLGIRNLKLPSGCF